MQEFDAVAEAAVQLRIYDVTLAIDDFGSGYSSFARLKQFPFSELKLDRSYVQNCASDPVNASICQSIVDLARASGAICVAEGIETEADCAALIRMGCNLGQGYLLRTADERRQADRADRRTRPLSLPKRSPAAHVVHFANNASGRGIRGPQLSGEHEPRVSAACTGSSSAARAP